MARNDPDGKPDIWVLGQYVDGNRAVLPLRWLNRRVKRYSQIECPKRVYCFVVMNGISKQFVIAVLLFVSPNALAVPKQKIYPFRCTEVWGAFRRGLGII